MGLISLAPPSTLSKSAGVMMRTMPAPQMAPRHCAAVYAHRRSGEIFWDSASARDTAGLRLPPEMGPIPYTRMVIMPPNTSDTSSCRAVVMPPSCVNTTQPIVQKRNKKHPTYSAVTAWRNSVVYRGKGRRKEKGGGGRG